MGLLDLLRRGVFSLGNKKKYLGKLSLFYGLLFCLLLGFSFTSCYASTTMLTRNQAEYIYDYIFKTTYDSNSYVNLNHYPEYYVKSKSSLYQDGVNSLLNNFNNYNDLPISENNTIFWVRFYNNNDFVLYWGNFNNSKGNDSLDYLYIKFNPNDATKINLLAYNPYNQTINTNYSIRAMKFDVNSSRLSFSNFINTVKMPTNENNFNLYWYNKPYNWNYDNVNNGRSVIDNISGIISFQNTNAIYTNYNGAIFFDSPTTQLLKTLYSGGGSLPDDPTPPPDTGNTGDITDDEGNITGSIDLSGIQNQLGTINNNINDGVDNIIDNQNQNTQAIVGSIDNLNETLIDDADELIEDTKITSGDIESALGFKIVSDPYSNFWFTLTNNLKNALLGTKRSIDITFQNRTWTISLDDYMVLPPWLTIILIPISTAFFTWVLVRQWKHIFDKLSSGNIDSILKENSEERHF